MTNFKTVDTGGGCMVDIITLKSGEVIVANDEYVGAYESEEAFWEGDESSALFGDYTAYADTPLDALNLYRSDLIADIPNGEYARNWQRWDELDMIDEAIAIIKASKA